MDDNIGRIVRMLKAKGVYENTLILFVSDNGCSGEMGVFGTHFKGGMYDYTAGKLKGEIYSWWGKRNGRMGRQGQARGVAIKKTTTTPGRSSAVGNLSGQGWASYSNTPFRKFKKFVHEGE